MTLVDTTNHGAIKSVNSVALYGPVKCSVGIGAMANVTPFGLMPMDGSEETSKDVIVELGCSVWEEVDVPACKVWLSLTT